jgi:hypothetical protein
MDKTPTFDRTTLTYAARRLPKGISVEARFEGPKVSTGERGEYVLRMLIDPKTRGLLTFTFDGARDGAKYLARHGGGHAQLQKLALKIRDTILRSDCWAKLENRTPDPHYHVNHLGEVFVRKQQS